MSINKYRNYDPLNGFDEEYQEVKQPNTPKFTYTSEKDLEIYKKCCEKIYNDFKITNIDRFCDMYKDYVESKKVEKEDNYYGEEIKEESESSDSESDSESERDDDIKDPDYQYESTDSSDSDSDSSDSDSESEKEDNYYGEEIKEESDFDSDTSDSDDDIKDPDYHYESTDSSDSDSDFSESDSESEKEDNYYGEEIKEESESSDSESDSESERDDDIKDPDYQYESDDSSEYDSEYDSENDFENDAINNDNYIYSLKITKILEYGTSKNKISNKGDIMNFLYNEFFYRYQEYCGDNDADICDIIEKMMVLMLEYNVYDDYYTWNDRQYSLSKQSYSGYFLSKSQDYRKNIKLFDLFELC